MNFQLTFISCQAYSLTELSELSRRYEDRYLYERNGILSMIEYSFSSIHDIQLLLMFLFTKPHHAISQKLFENSRTTIFKLHTPISPYLRPINLETEYVNWLESTHRKNTMDEYGMFLDFLHYLNTLDSENILLLLIDTLVSVFE